MEKLVSTPSITDLPKSKINIKDLATYHSSARNSDQPSILVNTFSADTPKEPEGKEHSDEQQRLGAKKKASLTINPIKIEDKLLAPIQESDSSSKDLPQPSMGNG